jgi:membrane protein
MQAEDTSLVGALRKRIGRIDRDRAVMFGRFLMHRFVDDRCFESAGALAYTTVFALVPFAAVVLSLLAVFPVFDQWTERVTQFIFANFVPASASVLAAKLDSFKDSVKALGATGVLALVASILLTMWSIEQTFNRIWRVPAAHPKLVRFLMYWALLTLGSLVTVAALTTAAAFFSIPELAGVEALSLGEYLLRYLPLLLELLAFTAAYWLIPHRGVRLRFAFAGGLLAMLLFEFLKWALAIYLRGANFHQLYGTLVLLPILLVWIYFSWLAVLFGASLAASLGSFRYQPRAFRLSPGAELYGVLRLLGRFEEARRDGIGLHLAELQQREPGLTDEMLQWMVSALAEMNILQRGESGAWLLSRDLHQVRLEELYEGMSLRLPTGELCLPQWHDAIGRAAQAALDGLRDPLRAPLARSVASYLEDPRPTTPTRELP